MPEKKIEKLLKKYLKGTATPEEEKLVDEWYDSLSEREQIHLSDSEKSSLRNVYWNALRSKIISRAGNRPVFWPRLLAVAASISIVLTIFFYLMPQTISENVADLAAPLGRSVIESPAEESKSVTLPDGSSVRLFANSRLEFGTDFNVNGREVRLSGEAFFDIVHDKEKPFYVFANEVVTKVLGTSFTVRAYPGDESITVAVTTGKVSVFAPHATTKTAQLGQNQEIILTPNQQAVYTRAEHKVSRTLVKEPKPVIADEEVAKVRFDGAPVSEVFAALEKMYNVDIEFEEEVFSNCAITTSVSGKDMFERIDVICEIIGASYKIEETTIVIIGTGCN